LAELSFCRQCVSDLAQLPIIACASDSAELSVCGHSVPIWQNNLHVEERASDIAELPVPVIWQNCLSMDSVPVIWQNIQYVEEHASDLAEMPVPVIWQNCLSVEEHASDLAELPECGGVCQ
jgi:hypothetical protein